MKIDAKIFKESMYRVSTKMREEKEYLIQLDAEHGDGDLGISMSNGFDAVSNFLSQTEENDIGRLLLGQAGSLMKQLLLLWGRSFLSE